MFYKQILLIVITAATVVACSSQPVANRDSTIDPVLVGLSQAATRIADAHESQAKIQSSRYQPDYKARSYSYEKNDQRIPSVWKEPLTLIADYHGDVQSFIEMLSAMAEIEPPRVIGVVPSKPRVINIPAGSHPLIQFLAIAGYQAGESVIVKPVIKLNQVLVHYKG